MLVYPEPETEGDEMPNTTLPPDHEKAHEIARRIANERPMKKDKDAPESNVSGGFNQKSRPDRETSSGSDAAN